MLRASCQVEQIREVLVEKEFSHFGHQFHLRAGPKRGDKESDFAESGREACGRPELRALTFLEARYGAFSAKMQTAGTLPVPSRYPPGTLYIFCTFRRGLIGKIRQKSGNFFFGRKLCRIFAGFSQLGPGEMYRVPTGYREVTREGPRSLHFRGNCPIPRLQKS